MVNKNMTIMLSRFHPIPERYGRTDIIPISLSRARVSSSVLTRDKNQAAQLLQRGRSTVRVVENLAKFQRNNGVLYMG